MTLAARVAAGFTSTNWLWGIEPARYWPAAGRLALLALALAGWVPAFGGIAARALERLGRVWTKSRGLDLVVAAAVALLLYLLRDPVRFTGDSSLRVGVLTLPPAFAQRLLVYYFPLDLLVNVGVPRALVQQGLDPERALQLVGALVGGAFAWAACRFLRAAGARGGALAAAALVVLGGGAVAHFAGYDKLGPLMLGLALAATGAVRVAREGRGLAELAAGAAICVLAHRSGFLVLPAVAWVLIDAFRRTRDGRGRRAVILHATAVLGVAALMLPRAIEVGRKLDLATHLPGTAVAGARLATGAPAALVHVAEALNVLTFLVPLWLLGLAAAWASRTTSAPADEARRERALAVAAWLALVPVIGMLLLVTTGGGWARDWDVAAGAAVTVSFAVAYALVARWKRAGGVELAGPIVTLALSAAIAFWGVHATAAIGMRRVESLLEDAPRPSDSIRAEAYDLLGQRALTAGQSERAVELITRAIACAPNPRYFHELGLAQEASGQLADAEASYRRSTGLAPRMPESWLGRVRLALARGDSLTAFACAESALARRPGEPAESRLRALLETRTPR